MSVPYPKKGSYGKRFGRTVQLGYKYVLYNNIIININQT